MFLIIMLVVTLWMVIILIVELTLLIPMMIMVTIMVMALFLMTKELVSMMIDEMDDCLFISVTDRMLEIRYLDFPNTLSIDSLLFMLRFPANSIYCLHCITHIRLYFSEFMKVIRIRFREEFGSWVGKYLMLLKPWSARIFCSGVSICVWID